MTKPKTSIKILVIEDDPIHLATFEMYIEELGYELVGHTDHSKKALALIAATQPDVIIMDIQIHGGKDGIQVAEAMKQEFSIPFIYVTSFKDEATFRRAKATKPHAYILKPFKKESLQFALELAIYRCYANSQAASHKDWEDEQEIIAPKSLFIKTKQHIVKVNTAKIVVIEVSGKYSIIHTLGKSVTARMTLNTFEEHLPSSQFIRVHRSFMINKEMIDNINLEQNVIVIQNMEIPIGRSYKELLLKTLNMIN